MYVLLLLNFIACMLQNALLVCTTKTMPMVRVCEELVYTAQVILKQVISDKYLLNIQSFK